MTDVFAVPYRKGDEHVLVVFLKEATVASAAALAGSEISVTRVPYSPGRFLVRYPDGREATAMAGDAMVRNLSTGEISLVKGDEFLRTYRPYPDPRRK